MNKPLPRRHFLAAAATVTTPPVARPKTPEIITIAYFLSARPILVGKALGWFQDGAKTRLAWTEVGGGAEINAALAAGGADLAFGISSLQTASGISQGIPYKVIGVEANNGQSEEMTVRHAANIRKPSDFKGKRVAVPFGSTSHFRLAGFLRTHGLGPGDVILLDQKPDAMVAAWGRGEIDAGYVWSPARTRLLAAGGDVFDTGRDLDGAGYGIADLIVARGIFLDQYPDNVSGLLKAYGRSIDMWKAKPTEAAEIVAKQAGVTVEAAQGEMNDCDFPPLRAQAGPAWLAGKLPVILKHTADFLVDIKALRSAPPQPVFDKAIDLAAVTRAQA